MRRSSVAVPQSLEDSETLQALSALVNPIAFEATEVLKDAEAVGAVAAAVQQSDAGLRSALRRALERSRAGQQRVVDAGIFLAVRAVVEGSTRAVGGQGVRWKRVHLCLGWLQAMHDHAPACTTVAARQADFHITLAGLLKLQSIQKATVSAVSRMLVQVLHRQSWELVLQAHTAGLTRGLVVNLEPAEGSMALLATALQCLSACIFVLRDGLRSGHVLSILLRVIRNTSSSQAARTSAVAALCFLLDSNLPAASACISDRRRLCSALLVQHSLVETVPALLSLLGKGTSAFRGQPKSSRLPAAAEVQVAASQWGMALGLPAVHAVATLLHSATSCAVHTTGAAVLCRLTQDWQLDADTALNCLSALKKSASTLAAHALPAEYAGARAVPQAVLQVAHSAGLQVTTNTYLRTMLQAPLTLLAQRIGTAAPYLAHVRTVLSTSSGSVPAEHCCICMLEACRGAHTTSCCSVLLHGSCLRRWLVTAPTCPLCRSQGAVLLF